jgi:group I intron endonuclease
MTIGIYKIHFSETPNKVYIGSSLNCEERWKAHVRTLRKNKHVNGHFQYAFDKHGEEKMVFEIIEVMESYDRKAIIEREKFYYYQAIDDGLLVYNAVVPMDRPLMTEALKAFLSKIHKGKTTWNKGIPMSEEARKKLSLSLKGRKSWNKGMKTGKPAWNKGKTMSEEHCKKLSEAHKGQIPWFKKRGVRPPKNTGRTWFKNKSLLPI